MSGLKFSINCFEWMSMWHIIYLLFIFTGTILISKNSQDMRGKWIVCSWDVVEAGYGSHVRSHWVALPCCQESVYLARAAQPECWYRCWKLKALRSMQFGGKAKRRQAAWQRSSVSRSTPADLMTSCCTKTSTLFASIFHPQWQGRLLSKHWVRSHALTFIMLSCPKTLGIF